MTELDEATAAKVREIAKRNAGDTLRCLVRWMGEHEDNATVLLASLSEAEIAEARSIFTRQPRPPSLPTSWQR